MAKKFKVGQVVQLRSGGPDMTVSDRDIMDEDHVWCQWFGGRKLEQGRFPIDSLIVPEPDGAKKK
jgi:uncharacterized protein YodC (DUF2158 family)